MAVSSSWRDYTPDMAEAMHLNLDERPDIEAPYNEEGERCPFPWVPERHLGTATGMFHCPYCGAMVLAGKPHIDYGPIEGASGR